LEHLPKGKYFVTVEGHRKLLAEMDELENKRGEIAGNIRTAKAYGDLSENFEYHEAKREQGFLEGRLAQLKQIIPQLHVVKPADVPLDRVSFGSVVTVRDGGGVQWDFFVVGPLEADPMDDRISYEAPLGAALIGRRVGDVVEAQVPAGKAHYEIVGLQAYAA
jgi:transcription elongation factor GreA